MTLVVGAARPRGATADVKKPLKGFSFTLAGDLRAIKSGKRLYLYVGEDGAILPLAGLFGNPLPSSVYRHENDALFKDRAASLYEIEDAPSEFLRGSRIDPTFLEVTRVDGNTVSGLLHNARDARLPFLDRSEKSEWGGVGSFSLDDVVALYDGGYFLMRLDPEAEAIEKVVEEQKALFLQLAGDENIKKQIDETRRLLKPYAFAIYKIENDVVHFVTRSGKWQAIDLPGNRKLDVWDRERIYEYAKENDLLGEDVRAKREAFFRKPMQERFYLKDLAPLFIEEVLSTREKDEKEIERLVKESAAKKPSDGLEPLPGLREGVEFPPHQTYLLSKIEHRDRMPVDADPGAGKSMLIIGDTLRQISLDRVKRPLVIMPNNLVSQFALEVRNFSELNPWIITTETVNAWGKGAAKGDRFTKMLEAAKAAPENTLFITSYHYLAAAKKKISNGVVKGTKYDETTVFTTPYRLLNELGVDAVYFDEVHSLKKESDQTKAASAFAKVKYVKGFTGTIMPGNLVDVLGMMGITHSAVLGTSKEFANKFSPNATINSYNKDAPKEIRKKLQRFGVPMVRSTVWGAMMPKVHRSYHFVEFNENQSAFYEALLKNSLEDIKKDKRLSAKFKQFSLGLEEQEFAISGPLLKRFAALDVFLNSPSEAEKYLGANLTGEDAISPKLKEINAICSKHMTTPSNGKILIFVQHKEAGKSLLKHLDANLRPYAEYYEGGMVDVLSRFKNPQSDLKILIGVDSTLRMGHNLQVANCIVHADTLWLSGDMRQREARSNRLKQQREVYIHHVIVRNSHELLKNARLMSQQHTIAKANSDFDDDTMLPHIEMTLDGMKSFRSMEQLDPLMARQKKIEAFSEKQTEVEKEFYGTHLMKPKAYEQLTKGKRLGVVPSTATFQGNLNDSTYMVEEELSEMKWEESAPKHISLHLHNWDGQWFLISFKSSDPNGFLRRMRFMLEPAYYYREVAAGGISAVIEDIEKTNIEIVNRDELEKGAAKARLLHPSRLGVIRKLEQESRKAVAAKAKDETVYQVEFYFSSIDGNPSVMTDNVKVGSKEAQLLKKKGFREGEPFWYLPIRRSALADVLKNLQDKYPDVRIGDWETFKEVARSTFGIDLSEFDGLGVK